MVLTVKEKRVLRWLAASGGKEYSINEIARACRMTPNGTYKILKKFEKEGILKVQPIANIRAYRLDFGSEKTTRVLELALMPDALTGRLKMRENDLRAMKAVTQAGVLFGSYITTKRAPGDLDILFVVERTNFEAYKRTLGKVQDITPVNIHDVVQTAVDLQQNLKKGDPIVIEALRNGIVLWGFATLVEAIKDVRQ